MSVVIILAIFVVIVVISVFVDNCHGKEGMTFNENKSVRTTMRLNWILWDILRNIIRTIRKTFLRVWSIQTVFLVISDHFLQ